MRTGWLPGVLLLACALPVHAQEARPLPVPEIDAGAVTTIVAQVPAPEGVDSAAYAVSLGAEYQSFAPLEGRVARLDDRFIIPVTFATPAQLPAGRGVAGTLSVRIAGGPARVHDLVIDVREQREVTFRLEIDELTVAPDAVVGLPYTLRNRGNVADTVYLNVQAAEGWSALDAPRLVLQPGEGIQGRIRLAAPVSTGPGDRQVVLVTARSAAAEATETVNLMVVSSAGWLGDLAHVPSSLFVGQSLGRDAGPVVALSGAGSIGPDTRFRLDLRHIADVVDPSLQRQAAGARLRASLIRPDLQVDAGDVYGFETTLSGSLRQARGVRAEYDPDGPLAFRAITALPTSFGGGIDGGHMLHGETEIATRWGAFTALAGDMLQPGRTTLASTRATGAGLRWSGARGIHQGSVEATALRFTAADSLQRFGPAVDARYGLSTGSVTGRVRLRRVPDAVASPGGQGNELAASVSARVAPSVYLVAWGHDVEQNLLGNGSRSTSRAANAGVRVGVGDLQLQLHGNYSDRQTRYEGGAFELSRRTVRFEGLYSWGRLAFQSDLEVGHSSDAGATGAYRSAATGVRLHGNRRWGWLRIQHTVRPGLETTTFNGGGTVGVGPVEVSGGLTASAFMARLTTTFWSGAEIQAQRNLSVHIGASARPGFDRDNWVFSLGLSRRLNLPLPVVRQPDLRGVVFEDANHNGAFDPGEPTVSGVGLAVGYLSTESDDEGRFAFRDAAGERLRLSSGTLPVGLVVAPGVSLPTRGDAAIPLVRTATLTLDLFLDRDEDGERDPAEAVGANVTVTLTGDQGWERTVIADARGRARITGLLPGHYAITARPTGQGGRATDAQVLMEVDLEPGESRTEALAVPLRRRTIRMGGDGGAFQFFEND
ncbi:MAG: hypothetical protein R6U63_09270 [Longimicrobiales bacterium]